MVTSSRAYVWGVEFAADSLMIKTGFCNALDLAGPMTRGWMIFWFIDVPRGVRPARGQQGYY